MDPLETEVIQRALGVVDQIRHAHRPRDCAASSPMAEHRESYCIVLPGQQGEDGTPHRRTPEDAVKEDQRRALALPQHVRSTVVPHLSCRAVYQSLAGLRNDCHSKRALHFQTRNVQTWSHGSTGPSAFLVGLAAAGSGFAIPNKCQAAAGFRQE
jgi:hypothetical protein